MRAEPAPPGRPARVGARLRPRRHPLRVGPLLADQVVPFYSALVSLRAPLYRSSPSFESRSKAHSRPFKPWILSLLPVPILLTMDNALLRKHHLVQRSSKASLLGWTDRVTKRYMQNIEPIQTSRKTYQQRTLQHNWKHEPWRMHHNAPMQASTRLFVASFWVPAPRPWPRARPSPSCR